MERRERGGRVSRSRAQTWLALIVLAVGSLITAIAGLVVYGRATASSAHPDPEAGSSITSSVPVQQALAEANPGFLYGRVTTGDDVTYEGRLRWGRDEEAFWGDYFNGAKDGNPWAAQVPPERLATRHPLTIFGFEFAPWGESIDLDRGLMARFGDIARIEALSPFNARVTLKSGTVVDVDRMDANDFDDGVRVWDVRGDVVEAVDLAPQQIRTIDFLPTARLGAAPGRLHGTVRTQQGDFTGFLQWNRQECIGSDTLDGRSADGDLGLRFDTLRSIARDSPDSSVVTLLDGRELVLSGSREVGSGNLGVYVDDLRYGRVLVSWTAFERVDFSPGGSGPAYGDFPPGRQLAGSVTTRAGRRLVGRLVYDLDESETIETLDVSSQGVTYMLPFSLVASIALPDREERAARRARVFLHNGEALDLGLTGDLGERNAGLLVFVNGRPGPEYVPWDEVEGIDFDRPSATSARVDPPHRLDRDASR